MEIKPGDTVRTRHGDVVRVVEFIDNEELRIWKCDNGCAYIEEDLTLEAAESEAENESR
jgi:hypothetical protein